MPTEKELQQQIDENDAELKAARIKLTHAKLKLDEAEGTLIGLKIRETILKEKLAQYIATTPKPNDYDMEEEAELERFRKVLPELMSRLK